MNDQQWTESLNKLKSMTQLRTLEGGPRSPYGAYAREHEYLTQRATELQTRERALERREGQLRAHWLFLRCAVVLFGIAILLTFAGAPVFLQWADQYWRMR